MRRHKQIWAVVLFMLLFVQSGLYFSGVQKPAGYPRCEKRTLFSQEREEETAIIAPLTAGDMKQLWTREKKSHFFFADFSQSDSYWGAGSTQGIYRAGKEKTDFDRPEKWNLADGLRAPPGTGHTVTKTA